MRGRPLDEMAVGDAAELTRVASAGDVAEFVDSIGDANPIHHDHDYAATTRFERPIVPGMWTAGLMSAVLGTRLPGPGSIYVSQQIAFTRPVYFGDTITARVEVVERLVERRRVRLSTVCVNQRGEEVLVGEALLSPPKTVVAYTERKVGSAAVTQLAAQPWLWAAQAAGAWLGANEHLALGLVATHPPSPAPPVGPSNVGLRRRHRGRPRSCRLRGTLDAGPTPALSRPR